MTAKFSIGAKVRRTKQVGPSSHLGNFVVTEIWDWRNEPAGEFCYTIARNSRCGWTSYIRESQLQSA